MSFRRSETVGRLLLNGAGMNNADRHAGSVVSTCYSSRYVVLFFRQRLKPLALPEFTIS